MFLERRHSQLRSGGREVASAVVQNSWVAAWRKKLKFPALAETHRGECPELGPYETLQRFRNQCQRQHHGTGSAHGLP